MDKKIKNLPEIKVKEIEKAKKKIWKFFELLADRYSKMADIENESNNPLDTLCIFLLFYGEVNNGGFIQLIQNGFGEGVFEENFSETIKSWGAIKTSEIIQKAKIIYEKNRIELEKEKSKEEFLTLYENLTDFEPLEVELYEIIDKEAEVIKKYIENNLNEFCVVV